MVAIKIKGGAIFSAWWHTGMSLRHREKYVGLFKSIKSEAMSETVSKK